VRAPPPLHVALAVPILKKFLKVGAIVAAAALAVYGPVSLNPVLATTWSKVQAIGAHV